jgi:hypothetical protein
MTLISSIVGGILSGAVLSFLVLMISHIPGFSVVSGAALPTFYAAALLASIIIAVNSERR